jgi:hypothetical protein
LTCHKGLTCWLCVILGFLGFWLERGVLGQCWHGEGRLSLQAAGSTAGGAVKLQAELALPNDGSTNVWSTHSWSGASQRCDSISRSHPAAMQDSHGGLPVGPAASSSGAGPAWEASQPSIRNPPAAAAGRTDFLSRCDRLRFRVQGHMEAGVQVCLSLVAYAQWRLKGCDTWIPVGGSLLHKNLLCQPEPWLCTAGIVVSGVIPLGRKMAGLSAAEEREGSAE